MTEPAIALAFQRHLSTMTARPVGLTVETVIEQYMARYNGRDCSIVQRLAAWRALIGTRTLDAVTVDVVRAARAALYESPALNYKGKCIEGRAIFRSKAKAKSAATVNRYMAALSSVLSWAIEERLTPEGWTNPCRGIRLLREPRGRVRFLDADELEQLLSACKDSRYKRMYALVLTAICTGARRGELLAMRWGAIDLAEGTARLDQTKNGDARTLVLLPQVVAALEPFVSSEPRRFVFGSPRTHYQTPADIGSAWKAAVARARIKDFRFHDLRHCCASYLAQNGVDINTIREVMGHRKLDMAQRYTHLNVNTRASAMLAALGSIGR